MLPRRLLLTVLYAFCDRKHREPIGPLRLVSVIGLLVRDIYLHAAGESLRVSVSACPCPHKKMKAAARILTWLFTNNGYWLWWTQEVNRLVIFVTEPAQAWDWVTPILRWGPTVRAFRLYPFSHSFSSSCQKICLSMFICLVCLSVFCCLSVFHTIC